MPTVRVYFDILLEGCVWDTRNVVAKQQKLYGEVGSLLHLFWGTKSR